ncbi:serine/threonine protein kinase [Streptosporangiaceae bacterium NEAU-GS5]|nr:serine/threonine protein kinase [Streptosporangiaceae bacterium NEAU-GS5]
MADRLGPYQLLSRLGAGGFGEVHLALDKDGRTVAVKVLHPHVASDALALTRLAREFETMRRVRGPHIAEVLDASLTGEQPYIVTRYVQGRALSTVAPVDNDDLVRLARGLAEALASIHAAGIVHRDLKPANVILAEGEPYVIDFGIAVALDAASVTASGAVVGTPGYLAPEVLEGRDAGPESDVFAWAATLAYAVTGRQPYGTGPAPAVAYRVVHGEPDLSDVPSWLGPLLRDCMHPDPAARPTAPQLVARLGGIVPAPAPAAVRNGVPRAPEPVTMSGGSLHEALTREWVPGDKRTPTSTVEEARRRRRERLHQRWIVGSGVVTALAAAAARAYLPQVSLLLLVTYGVALVIDAGFGLLGGSRRRVVVDVVSGLGAVGLWGLLSALFSTAVLVLAVGTVVFLLLVLIVSS